jgi:hypothetical protein
MAKSLLAALAFGIALSTSLWSPGRAQADAVDTMIGADVEYAVPVESEGDSGFGVALRGGLQLHLPFVALTPEIGLSYQGFTGIGDPSVFSGVAGLRAGFGEVLRLGGFAHAGVGHLDLDMPGADPSRTSFTYDAGVFLDVTLLPLLDVGAHVAYNQLIKDGEDDAFHWMTFGAHAALIF